MADLLEYALLVLLILIPAIIIFVVINLRRLRRESFHRARQQQRKADKNPERAE